MPVQIRELNIKINIENPMSGKDGVQQQGTASSSGNLNSGAEQIIDECIDQVLTIMKRKKER